MTNSETVWSFALTAMLLLGFVIFRRIRRRTRDFVDAQTFRSRMPAWAAMVERFNWSALTLLIGAGIFRAFFLAHRTSQPGHHVEGADAVYVVTGVLLIALPMAMLCANWISWVVPPLRRANTGAMSGLNVSFASANRGLLLFGAISIPLGLILLALAVIEPWRA